MGILCQVIGVFGAVGYEVFALAAPGSPVVGHDYHTADSAQGVAYVVVAGCSRKTVKHYYAGMRFVKICGGPYYFAIDMAAVGNKIQGRVVGQAVGSSSSGSEKRYSSFKLELMLSPRPVV